MSEAQSGLDSRGNQADYVLGTPEGWDAFGVVRWHGVEEISQPYRYDITLTRPASSGPVDLDGLLDAGATFRIAASGKWRVIHGVLAEAEEIDRTSQIILYRVLLVPHVWHARYRRRCRNFLKKTLKEIVSAVLENRSPAHPAGLGGLTSYSSSQAPLAQPSWDAFTPPTASYRWDVKDTSRIEDTLPTPYIVQYNESDFDFFSRLLEVEGLSYYFEHAQDQVTLAITDSPGVSPLFDEPTTWSLRRATKTSSSLAHDTVRWFRDARRLRSRAVAVRDWDYHRSAGPLEASVVATSDDPDLAQHFEFPAGEESVKKDPGMHAALVRVQRYGTERALREGSSNIRAMETGRRFTLHDEDGAMPDTQLLAVRVETFATERAVEGTVLDEEPFGFAHATGTPRPGYDGRFLALSSDVPFRPEMRTPKPRIHGVQAAIVTAEEYPSGDRPAINGDDLGRVRVRFPWDQRDDQDDQTPTSRWIRVSQFWAGGGYGALYTPRVGHEVLVAYMQGDPDDPVIVGRVYNATHTPPYDASQEPTKSTVKSQSAEEKKEVEGYNEIRFEDKAKKEEIYLHAQKDFNEVVLANHSTSVGGDQSNSVQHNQTNTVKGHREHTITDYETVTVGDDRTTVFQANEHHSVAGFRDTSIGANEALTVGGFRASKIGANDDLEIGGWHNTKVGGGETFTVSGKRDVVVGADYTVKVTGNFTSEASSNHVFKSTNTYILPTGDFQTNSTTAGFNQSSSFYIKAGSASLTMCSGIVTINNGAGASITLLGGLVLVNAGASLMLSSSGPVMTTAGAPMTFVASGDISATAPNIHLNG